MVIVVPFDGGALSVAALQHAEHAAKLYDVSVVAVTVVPVDDVDYARERGWISRDEAFAVQTIVTRLRDQVTEICPEATFDYIPAGAYTSSGTISSKIRRYARDNEASAVFIGSENAGRMVIGITSVGGRVAADLDYDVAIIRQPVSGDDLPS